MKVEIGYDDGFVTLALIPTTKAEIALNGVIAGRDLAADSDLDSEGILTLRCEA